MSVEVSIFQLNRDKAGVALFLQNIQNFSPTGKPLAGNGIAPTMPAVSNGCGKGGRLFMAIFVQFFGKNISVLAVEMVNPAAKLVQKAQLINAHSNQVGWIIVDAKNH